MEGASLVEIASGIILFAEKFQDCRQFYRNGMQLPILMEKPGIVRFAFGSMYLQIEDAKLFGAEPTRNIIIRKNVASISHTRLELEGKGIVLEVHDLEWGEIGFAYDPGGNKVEYFREKQQ
jgi:lactoylglutathione lyase